MTIRGARLNTYLFLLLGIALGSGCQSDKNQKKAPKKGYNLLRLHIEVNPDGADKSTLVSVGRHASFPVNITMAAFVDEGHLTKVSLFEDAVGGFKIMLQLNRQGAWLLEQYTVSNKGRRIVVSAELEGLRWVAAPLITKRITDGIFTFTPDATREEAEKLVLGLNHTIKKLRSRNTFNDPEP